MMDFSKMSRAEAEECLEKVWERLDSFQSRKLEKLAVFAKVGMSVPGGTLDDEDKKLLEWFHEFIREFKRREEG